VVPTRWRWWPAVQGKSCQLSRSSSIVEFCKSLYSFRFLFTISYYPPLAPLSITVKAFYLSCFNYFSTQFVPFHRPNPHVPSHDVHNTSVFGKWATWPLKRRWAHSEK
jgi:hypothetical protein